MFDVENPANADLPLRLQWFAPWRWRKRYRFLVLFVFPAYVLSTGPIVWIDSHVKIDPANAHLIEQFYSPLEYACIRSEWCAVALDSYLRWWRALP